MPENLVYLLMTLTVLVGYGFIVLEQFLRIDKTAVVLLMAVICWIFFFLNPNLPRTVEIADLQEQFLHVNEVAGFVLLVLVIIEIMQVHEGFSLFTERLRPKSKKIFLWTIGLITFFLSTMIANVTATVIMLALTTRFLKSHEDRMVVGAGIVVASNAGGAWTPIGDVTTTMLWIADRITTLPTMRDLFLPSLVSMVVTFIFLTRMLKGSIDDSHHLEKKSVELPYRKLILCVGIFALMLIPLLHAIFNFPPYMGAILGVGLLWVATDLCYPNESKLRAPAILTRIDLSTYFFFLGILLTVRALDSAGILRSCEVWFAEMGLMPQTIAVGLGMLSGLLDNVPLVAASIGVYPVSEIPTDSPFWQLLAYCAGVGGSLLTIGSPAGIAYMNIEKVPFFWFVKKITLPILVGFFAGVAVYLYL
ncbi:MAG: hypothetical protein JWO53_872 [Chlamydiia bacterium]|nr:hypothetical protein [Chlamydiia bacterium]